MFSSHPYLRYRGQPGKMAYGKENTYYPTHLTEKPKTKLAKKIKCKRERDKAAKEKQAYHFNRRHGVLRPGDSVLLKLDDEAKWKGPATVLAESAIPRSYKVFSKKEGKKRRNRRHLQLMPDGVSGITLKTEVNSEQSPLKVRPHVDSDVPAGTIARKPNITRSDRVSKPAERLNL